MDTTKLAVGQEVFVVSGCYYSDGWVVKVTPEGVEVQLASKHLHIGLDNKPIWQTMFRFDAEGKACDGFRTGEYGPYIIDDMPFEERKAELVGVRDIGVNMCEVFFFWVYNPCVLLR
jgi:hypothetical protein